MSSSQRTSPAVRFFFGRLFPLPFIIIGVIAFCIGARNIYRAHESLTWPTAEGHIESSSVEYHDSSEGSGTYGAEVRYTFTVDDRAHHGEKVAFGDLSSSNRSRAQNIVNRYEKGKAVSVHYLAADPDVCVLEPGMKSQVWFMPVFGLVFFAAGTFMAIALPRAMKPAPTVEQVQAMYPGQPWMVRPDWAAGCIRSSSQALPLLIMGLAFCAIGGMVTAFTLPDELHDRNYIALVVLLFPLVGLGLLGGYFYARSAGGRFGDCAFQMASIPGVLGGTLQGIIQTGARLQLEHGMRVTLSCISAVTTGSGKNRSQSERVLWQDEKVLKNDLPESEPGRTCIPVFFHLPADQPESTGCSGSDDGIHWRLEARARVAGPDLHVKFDVPVFNVAVAADAQAAETDPTASLQMPIEDIRRDEHSRIQVNESPVASEFFFPAARNTGAAFSMTFAFVLLAAIATALIVFRVPIIFGIITGLFALLFLAVSLPLWLRQDRVSIDRRGVRDETRWLFFGRTREFGADDVTGFNTKVGMSSGNKRYHDIQLTTRSGRNVTIAIAVADKAEADWLVQKMTAALRRSA